MRKNLQFIVGKYYRVTKANNSIIQFQFIGGNPPMVLLNPGGTMTLKDAVANYIEIRQID